MDRELKSGTQPALLFGPFRLLPKERLIERNGVPVTIGGRSLDILLALIEHAGEVVSKKELIAKVWPDVFVGDGSLRFHVTELRKALGDGQSGVRYVTNVPRRGYCFVAPLLRLESAKLRTPHPGPSIQASEFPRRLTKMVGREQSVAEITAQLMSRRFVSIVGPGGIGKTTVATAVAHALQSEFPGAVRFVDLGRLSDPALVPITVASALGLSVTSEDATSAIIDFLSNGRMVLMLDSCEHVIDVASRIAERLTLETSGVHLVATSRESLRVDGECVHRLFPLASPPETANLTVAEVMTYPAAQLLVERAARASSGFQLIDIDAPAVAKICHKLDGIPLAIELAAGRIETYGLRGTAALLDDRFQLLWRGRRTALPRHQTLSDTIDWSYDLLSGIERTILQRLSVFAGSFTLNAAAAIVSSADLEPEYAIESLESLVAKSLVATLSDGDVTRYRLLDATRVYAAKKLEASGAADAIAQRHASYYTIFLESQAGGRDGLSAGGIGATCSPELDNVREALRWTLSAGKDAGLGVALAAAATHYWLEMSLLTECKLWADKALARLDEAGAKGSRNEMVLQNALCFAIMFSQGLNAAAQDALTKFGELAAALNDFEYQMLALVGLASFCHRLENLQHALELSRRAEVIANEVDEPFIRTTADCLLGTSYYLRGEFPAALAHALKVGRATTPIVRETHIARFGLDYAVEAKCVVASVYLAQGLFDQAARATREVVAYARTVNHPNSLCLALSWSACPISLALGDEDEAQEWIGLLRTHAERHDVRSQYACALGFEGLLAARRGNFVAAELALRACLGRLREAKFEIRYTTYLGALAEVLIAAGKLEESFAAATEALQRSEKSNGHWWMPEALRIKGEVLMACRPPDFAAAEECFSRSLSVGCSQGALMWQLRSTMSLARLRARQGRVAEARRDLAQIRDQFSEGFGSADLRASAKLLAELAGDVSYS